MKNIKIIFSLSVIALVALVSSAVVDAALVPTFLLGVANNSTQVQVTVIGADPNAPVTLYYPQNGSYTPLSLPATDGTGHLSYLVSASLAPTVGGLAYVTIDGAQSQTQVWPSVTGSAAPASSGMALSQNYLTVIQGQSSSVTASGGNGNLGALSVPADTNPSVAYVSAISGSQISVTGSVPGSATLTVCGANVGCTSLYVTVQAPSSSSTGSQTSGNPAAVSLSPSALTIAVGQNQTVSLSGPGSYYISAHSNSGIDSTSLSGSILTVGGSLAGTDLLSVCGTSGNSTSCTTLSVTVTGSATNNSTAQPTVTFSPSQVNLTVGQSQSSTITGSGLGSYYVSGNSDSAAVSASLTGNTVVLTGVAPGGANVTVCQLGGACGQVYGFVPVSGTSGTPGTTAVSTAAATNLPLALSSFNISSNNVNNTFLGTGAALTFTYSFNQAVSSQSIMLDGQAVSSYGSGSGPYTSIYTMTGNEGLPLTVSLSFANANGATGRYGFTFGPSSGTSAGSSAGTSGSNGSSVFSSYLEVGSTGSQVTALQTRLTALGIYSGPITGTFGGLTEAAVKAYQAKHGLTQLGAVGPATRSLLNQGL